MKCKKKKLKGWHIALIVIGVILAIAIVGASSKGNKNNKVVGATTSNTLATSENSTESTEAVQMINVLGITADKAKENLKAKGFTNITLDADETGKSKTIIDSKNWTVTAQNPLPTSKIALDNEITLICKKTYEVEQEKEQKELERMTSQFNDLIDKSVSNAITETKKAGYTPTYLHNISHLSYTDELGAHNKEELDKWTISKVGTIDVKNKTVVLYIDTAENTEETTEKISGEKNETPITSSSKSSNSNFQTYNNQQQQNTTEYVLNTNSKKVHRPGCRAVKKISPQNYSTIGSLDDALAQGYDPCGICKP